MKNRFCAQCGAELPGKVKVCPNCGKKQKSNTLLIVLLVVFVVPALLAMVTGGGSAPASQSTPTSQSTSHVEAASPTAETKAPVQEPKEAEPHTAVPEQKQEEKVEKAPGLAQEIASANILGDTLASAAADGWADEWLSLYMNEVSDGGNHQTTDTLLYGISYAEAESAGWGDIWQSLMRGGSDVTTSESTPISDANAADMIEISYQQAVDGGWDNAWNQVAGEGSKYLRVYPDSNDIISIVKNQKFVYSGEDFYIVMRLGDLLSETSKVVLNTGAGSTYNILWKGDWPKNAYVAEVCSVCNQDYFAEGDFGGVYRGEDYSAIGEDHSAIITKMVFIVNPTPGSEGIQFWSMPRYINWGWGQGLDVIDESVLNDFFRAYMRKIGVEPKSGLTQYAKADAEVGYFAF